MRKLLESVLTEHGYTVLAAERPSDALEIVANADQPIDLLISDVMLPGMSGYDLAATVLERRPGIRRILISGYADGLRSTVHELEPNVPLLQKPFTPNELVNAVRAAMVS